MKRIYYGTLTIDVPTAVADLVMTLASEAASSRHHRSVRMGNAFGSQGFAVGRTEHVTVFGYVNDASDATSLELLVGRGMPLAVGAITSSKTEPADDTVLGRLTAQVGEYSDDGS